MWYRGVITDTISGGVVGAGSGPGRPPTAGPRGRFWVLFEQLGFGQEVQVPSAGVRVVAPLGVPDALVVPDDLLTEPARERAEAAVASRACSLSSGLVEKSAQHEGCSEDQPSANDGSGELQKREDLLSGFPWLCANDKARRIQDGADVVPASQNAKPDAVNRSRPPALPGIASPHNVQEAVVGEEGLMDIEDRRAGAEEAEMDVSSSEHGVHPSVRPAPGRAGSGDARSTDSRQCGVPAAVQHPGGRITSASILNEREADHLPSSPRRILGVHTSGDASDGGGAVAGEGTVQRDERNAGAELRGNGTSTLTGSGNWRCSERLDGAGSPQQGVSWRGLGLSDTGAQIILPSVEDLCPGANLGTYSRGVDVMLEARAVDASKAPGTVDAARRMLAEVIASECFLGRPDAMGPGGAANWMAH